MRTLYLCVCLGVATVGCKKDPSQTAATTASAAPLAFLDQLPEDTRAFGYVHLDKPWIQSIAPLLAASHKAMVADVQAMAKRRFGAEISGLRSIGFAVIDKRPILFLGGIAGQLKASRADNVRSRDGVAIVDAKDVAVAQAGSLWMVGDPKDIERVVAGQRSPQRLTRAHASWARWALAEAQQAPAMVTFRRDPNAQRTSRTETDEISDVELATVVAAATGLHVAMVASPGKGAAVESQLQGAMQRARTHVDRVIARGSDQTAQSELVAALAQHYGDAWLGGIALRRDGDRLAVDVPWRKPDWDVPFAPAPAWSARAIAPQEFVAAQINLGRPALEQFLRWSDVLGKPLDRAALQRQLTAIFTKHVGASYRDFSAVSFSGGNNALLVSFVAPTADPAPRPQPFKLTALAASQAAIEPAPWGTALARAKEANVLKRALAAPPPQLPLLRASKIANGQGEKVFLRGAVDLLRLPPEIAPAVAGVPLVSLEFRAGEAGFEAEVATQPGKSAGVMSMINMAKAVLKGQSEHAYKNRESLQASEELIAIFQYHQAAAFDRIAVTDLGNDRIHVSLSSAEMGENYIRFMAPVALIGIAAAVAIPVFIKHTAAAAIAR